MARTFSFGPEGEWLTLRLSDNGRGFDAEALLAEAADPFAAGRRGGNGLINMRRRAQELGGVFEVETAPGAGTTITLRVPLGERPGASPHPNGG